jgi:periplasmic copper chaperone A
MPCAAYQACCAPAFSNPQVQTTPLGTPGSQSNHFDRTEKHRKTDMRLFREFAFTAALTLGALASFADAQAHEMKIGDLVIDHPWSRQSPMGATVAAGFLTITNNGKEEDRLLKATAAITPNVQLHDMKMDGDVMKMVEIAGGIAIPPGATVELKPMSQHIMFMDLKAPVKEGDVVAGTLTFEKAGTVDIQYEVMAPNTGMH